MVTALLAILVTAMFAIVMLGVILSQTMPTQLQQATTRTVFAAEAGVNAVVGQLRNAQNGPDGAGKIFGVRKLLPCTSAGKVTSGGTALAYSADIWYYTQDPTHQTLAWQQSAANRLTCTPGAGPSQDPTHALIRSTAAGLVVQNAVGNVARTIEVVYAFQITNTNIPGGFIKTSDPNKPNDPPRFCLQADSADPGAFIRYVDKAYCIDGSANQQNQMWVYNTSYEIVLAATTLPSYVGSPLCISGVADPHLTATKVTLQVCDPANTAELWSYGESYTWQGQNNPLTAGKSIYYLTSGVEGSVSAGSYLQMMSLTGRTQGEWSRFSPDARVGAGPAGFNTHQIVNYEEFGRCADVTGQDLGDAQMISYPCKQDPNPDQKQLLWNHKWYYAQNLNDEGSKGPQQITVKYNDVNPPYCLRSAGGGGGFVTFSTTCTTTDPHFQWTRYGHITGASYAEMYLFKDGYGNCLDLGPSYNNPLSANAKNLEYSTLVTTPCNGKPSQKWNAQPNVSPAALGSYWELNP